MKSLFLHKSTVFVPTGQQWWIHWDFGKSVPLSFRRSSQGGIEILNNDPQPVLAAGVAGVSPAHRMDICLQLKVRYEIIEPGQNPLAVHCRKLLLPTKRQTILKLVFSIVRN